MTSVIARTIQQQYLLITITCALLTAKLSAYVVVNLGLKQDPGMTLPADTDFIEWQAPIGGNKRQLFRLTTRLMLQSQPFTRVARQC